MIYADHHATTPCLPEAAAAVAAALAAAPGNPGSRQHPGGRAAQAIVDDARAAAADLLGVRADGIIFTSGATEALNLAILGVMERQLAHRPRIVAPATEHPAVLAPLARLAEAGAEVIHPALDRAGRVLSLGVDGRTALVCLQAVNQETGLMHDLPALAAEAHAAGALVLCDATQAPSRMAVDAHALGADLVACSSHKIYGPPGVGVLWLRPGLGLAPQIHGGGQERGLRGGTPNVPALAGFAVAARVARERADLRGTHLRTLTARLEAALQAALPRLVIHAADARRAPGVSMITLPDLRPGWLAQLAAVAASGGSACSSGTGQPSPVLTALGVPSEDARNSLRLSLGEGTTAEDVDAIAAAVIRGARRLADGWASDATKGPGLPAAIDATITRR